MTARITKPAQDALGRASLLEQVRLSREAELSRLRAISGPQPHRHATLVEMATPPMQNVQAVIGALQGSYRRLEHQLYLERQAAISQSSDAQPHPSAD